MLILILLLALTLPATADAAALWNTMHLTAQAAMDATALAQARASSPCNSCRGFSMPRT